MTVPRPARILAAAAALALVAPALAQDDEALGALERRTEEVARSAAASVVGVTAIPEAPNGPRLVLPGLVLAAARPEPERVEATGILLDHEGLVATTLAVARGARFELRLADGTVRDARLLGADEPFRLAVLRTAPVGAARPVTTAADEVAPGRRALGWLVTFARSGEPDVQVTTVRPAACADTSYDRWLSAATALAEGAAGSPLLARDGRLLAMAAGAASARTDLPQVGTSCGSSLFVRGDDVLQAAREIAQQGRVRRPRLGVLLEGAENRVDQLVPGGPAEHAGLREGDRVVAVADVAVANAQHITRALLRRRTGESVPVEAIRGGAALTVQVALAEAPLPPAPADAPLAGALLELTPGAPRSVVRVTALETASPFAAAGLRVGDEILRVDGADVLRFLSRHRVRPSATAPSELVVRRDAEELTLRR